MVLGAMKRQSWSRIIILLVGMVAVSALTSCSRDEGISRTKSDAVAKLCIDLSDKIKERDSLIKSIDNQVTLECANYSMTMVEVEGDGKSTEDRCKGFKEHKITLEREIKELRQKEKDEKCNKVDTSNVVPDKVVESAQCAISCDEFKNGRSCTTCIIKLRSADSLSDEVVASQEMTCQDEIDTRAALEKWYERKSSEGNYAKDVQCQVASKPTEGKSQVGTRLEDHMFDSFELKETVTAKVSSGAKIGDTGANVAVSGSVSLGMKISTWIDISGPESKPIWNERVSVIEAAPDTKYNCRLRLENFSAQSLDGSANLGIDFFGNGISIGMSLASQFNQTYENRLVWANQKAAGKSKQAVIDECKDWVKQTMINIFSEQTFVKTDVKPEQTFQLDTKASLVSCTYSGGSTSKINSFSITFTSQGAKMQYKTDDWLSNESPVLFLAQADLDPYIKEIEKKEISSSSMVALFNRVVVEKSKNLNKWAINQCFSDK